MAPAAVVSVKAAVAVANEPPPEESTSPNASTIAPTTAPATLGRVTALLSLGNYAIIEVEARHGTKNESDGGGGGGGGGGRSVGDDGDGGGGGGGGGSHTNGHAGAATTSERERRLVRLDDRVELLGCRGELFLEQKKNEASAQRGKTKGVPARDKRSCCEAQSGAKLTEVPLFRALCFCVAGGGEMREWMCASIFRWDEIEKKKSCLPYGVALGRNPGSSIHDVK